MDIRVSKSIQRISVIGNGSSTVLYKRKKRKKAKSSAGVGTLERVIRRITEADGNVVDKYRADHNKSRRKRRDGWLRDLPRNVMRADMKVRKPLRKLIGIG